MKVYTFRLGVVARIRALEERVARERFMLATRDRRLAEEREREAAAQLARLVPLTGDVLASEVLWSGAQSERQAVIVRERHEEVVRTSLLRDEAHEAWSVASKRAGVLERLREQGVARWRDDLLGEEAAELDDLSNARFSSKSAR
jgi:hypothetical protein